MPAPSPSVSYQSIVEGHAPNRLFWQLGPLNPFRLPRPEDFTPVDGRRLFGAGDARNVPLKPFASRNEPWFLAEYDGVPYAHTRQDGTDSFRWETPHGTLTARRQSNHMIEFPIKTVDDIPLWHYVQERLVYRENPAFSQEDRLSCRTMGFKWSPVQELLQFETGVENFHYFMADAPDLMAALMEMMHQENLEALETGFRVCPHATAFQFNENTSSELLSPSIYRKVTVPHIRAYADLSHRHGQRFIVHMCGHLMALLDGIAETGIDDIHAVTPPPVGNTHYMTVRERFGDAFIIVGRLNAQLFMGRRTADVTQTLKSMIPERLLRTPFALWITNDEMRLTEEDVLRLVDALETLNRKA